MKIRYIGHACFEVSENGYSVIFDPYEPDNVPGTLSISEEANDVCCSHEHGDHNYRAGVKLKAVENAPIKITEVSSYHDSEGGVVRGTNTIHVVDTESGLRAVHMGDIGHVLEAGQRDLLGNPERGNDTCGGILYCGRKTGKGHRGKSRRPGDNPHALPG